MAIQAEPSATTCSSTPDKARGPRQTWRPFAFTVMLAVMPMLVLTVLVWIDPPLLKSAYPIPLGTLSQLRQTISSTLHGWAGNDSFWTMSQAIQVLNGPMRDQLYEKLFFHDHVRFQYPVTSLLPLIALERLGLAGEYWFNWINDLVFIANAVTNAALAWILFPMKRTQAQTPLLRIAAAILSAAATIIFLPLLRAQYLGQLQLWVDLLFSASVLCWCLDYKLLAGTLIGAICTLKPQMTLLLIWGLLWREWEFALGLVTFAVLVLAISVLLFGTHNNLQYLAVLAFLSKHGESYLTNNSLNGILNWYAVGLDEFYFHTNAFPPYRLYIATATALTSLASLAAIALPSVLLRSKKANVYGFAAAAICTVVGAPIAWDHHYGILFPLYLVAIKFLISGPKRHFIAGAAAIWISWALVANFISYAYLTAGTSFAFLQAYCLFGALVLLAYLLVAASKDGSDACLIDISDRPG
jgi:hypothetical protein